MEHLRDMPPNSIQLADMLVYVTVILPVMRIMMPPRRVQSVEDEQRLLRGNTLQCNRPQ